MKTPPTWQIRGRLFVGMNDLLSDKNRLNRWLKRHGATCPNSVHVENALEQINAELRSLAIASAVELVPEVAGTTFTEYMANLRAMRGAA